VWGLGVGILLPLPSTGIVDLGTERKIISGVKLWKRKKSAERKQPFKE
jgi:hypothetical protein